MDSLFIKEPLLLDVVEFVLFVEFVVEFVLFVELAVEFAEDELLYER